MARLPISTCREELLFRILSSQCDKRGRICLQPLSLKVFANKLGVSKEYIYKIINQLEESGHIRKIYSGKAIDCIDILKRDFDIQAIREVIQKTRASDQVRKPTPIVGAQYFEPARQTSKVAICLDYENLAIEGVRYTGTVPDLQKIIGEAERLGKIVSRMAFTTPEGLNDLQFLHQSGFDVIVVPKSPDAADLKMGEKIRELADRDLADIIFIGTNDHRFGSKDGNGLKNIIKYLQSKGKRAVGVTSFPALRRDITTLLQNRVISLSDKQGRINSFSNVIRALKAHEPLAPQDQTAKEFMVDLVRVSREHTAANSYTRRALGQLTWVYLEQKWKGNFVPADCEAAITALLDATDIIAKRTLDNPTTFYFNRESRDHKFFNL